MASDKTILQLPNQQPVLQDTGVFADLVGTFGFQFMQLLSLLQANLSVGAVITFGTASIPSGAVGNNGDVYIKTDTGQFAQKISGTWTVFFTITQGVVGSTIYYGSANPSSSTGINGDTYLQTVGGVFWTKISGTWTIQFSMATGPTGPQGTPGTNGTNGTNGTAVLNGTGVPANNTLGIDGDFYINTSNYTFYGPRTGGIWGAGVSLFGFQLPIVIPFAIGTSLPIVFTGWQTLSLGTVTGSVFGRFPKLRAKAMIGGAILAGILSGGGVITPGVYPNITFTGGSGYGAIGTLTIPVSGVPSIVLTNDGNGYNIGDTLVTNFISGKNFNYLVTSASQQKFLYLTGETVITTEVTPGLPDTISIDVDNAGGVLGDSILLEISV